MMDDWEIRLRAVIKEAEEEGKSRRKISLAAGLGPNFVSQFMTSHRKPTIDKFLRLCRELNVSPIYIISGLHMTLDTEEFLRIFRTLSVHRREALQEFLAPEQEPEHTKALPFFPVPKD